MGSFGDRLRREREMRGISLDDIAESTKIGTRLLRALEDEHFEVLPGGIFNKGFVRAYAKYLGMNEEEAVADYLQAAGESTPDPRVIAEQNSSRIDRVSGDTGGSKMAGFPIIPVLILLVVIGAGVGGWHIYQEKMQQRRAKEDALRAAALSPSNIPPASHNVSANQPPSTATATSNTPQANNSGAPSDVTPAEPTGEPNQSNGLTGVSNNVPAAASQPGQTFEVVVRPKDRAWVSIKQDGKITVRGIIGPSDVKTIRATDQVVFWTGNAGAIDLSFNGQPVSIPGGANEVAVLVITPKGAVPAKSVAVKPTPAPASEPQ